MQDNPYFQPKIEAPPFRIVDGTYAYFDHPGYMGIALQFLGTICIVGTTTAFIAFAAHTIFLAYRAMVENRLLRGL
jgi:protein-S-isoprenylcysteine O-methyltransferase Ste14